MVNEMVSAFLGELSKRLAEKWLTVLVLPGLLFEGAVALAVVLGQGHALDVPFLLAEIGRRSRDVQSAGTTAVLTAALGLLLGAAGAGILAAAIAVPAEPPTRIPSSRARRRAQ